MNKQLNRNLIERFSRQIILKNIGIIGQKKILSSKVLIIGMGGLGCPIAEFLTRAGVGLIGIVDNDKINLSNLHRQTLYQKNDVVRMHGSTYICTTDKLGEDRRMGSQYKPEHDKEAWEQYTSGYIWTGQWMDKGEYYPGDVINYNGEQYAPTNLKIK